ncbi:CD47 protein, partial [Bucco capensis]|nr:CD47 protein [Bucco capensis]
GSAQLRLTATDVEITDCNTTIILPCYVLDLQAKDARVMIVTWKKEGKEIFSFAGSTKEIFRDPSFSSAGLASPKDLAEGTASLMLNRAEAQLGNYTCQVTESNREGAIKIELRGLLGSWFLVVERAIIIVLLFLVIVLSSAQLIVALKNEVVPQKKIGIIALGVISVVAAVVGTVLFVQDGYTAQNQAGLGLIVVHAVVLVLLQYFIFGIVFDSLPQATFALLGLQILGYIIAVVGFALYISACPPVHGSVVIAGLAIMAIASLLSLAYVFI